MCQLRFCAICPLHPLARTGLRCRIVSRSSYHLRNHRKPSISLSGVWRRWRACMAIPNLTSWHTHFNRERERLSPSLSYRVIAKSVLKIHTHKKQSQVSSRYSAFQTPVLDLFFSHEVTSLPIWTFLQYDFYMTRYSSTYERHHYNHLYSCNLSSPVDLDLRTVNHSISKF